jgi:hypothetical protein
VGFRVMVAIVEDLDLEEYFLTPTFFRFCCSIGLEGPAVKRLSSSRRRSALCRHSGERLRERSQFLSASRSLRHLSSASSRRPRSCCSNRRPTSESNSSKERLLPARPSPLPRSMEGADGRRKRGREWLNLDLRNQLETSAREAGWEEMRSRVPTGIHLHLNTPPLKRHSTAGILGCEWATLGLF